MDKSSNLDARLKELTNNVDIFDKKIKMSVT